MKRLHGHLAHTISDSSGENSNTSPPRTTDLSSHQDTDNSDRLQSKHARTDSPPPCPYGVKCYRKNPTHFTEFSHPSDPPTVDLTPSTSQATEENDCLISASKDDLKVFGLYLTRVSSLKSSPLPEISLREILAPDKGDLVSSVQFSYMFELDWLVQQYPSEFRSKPLLIVHGHQGTSKTEFEEEMAPFKQMTACQAPLHIMYGTHHTKMMLLFYTDSMRVVIHTANLIKGDWTWKTQGVWMSERLPRVAPDNAHDSPTHFRADLVEYLRAYQRQPLIGILQKLAYYDFSSVKVCLLPSTPGRFTGSKLNQSGHLRLRQLLNEHNNSNTSKKKLLVGQFSSIGSLGTSAGQWLLGEWLSTLSTSISSRQGLPTAQAPLKLIFPSVEDVRLSLEGYPAGGCLPYSSAVAARQPWLHHFFHRWRANRSHRTHASPHIKSYACFSEPDKSPLKLEWFALTSANLSKAAWGQMEKGNSQFMIRSYELGVLFLPKFHDCKEFQIDGRPSGDSKCFPLMWDMPLTSYSKDDEPWIVDVPHREKPDRHGNMWVPG